MAKIILTFNTLPEFYERLSEQHTLIRPPKGKDFSQEELKMLVQDADVLCSVFDIPIGRELLGNAPKLRLVANYAVGYNNIDLDYCREHGIAVTNLPPLCSYPNCRACNGTPPLLQ